MCIWVIGLRTASFRRFVSRRLKEKQRKSILRETKAKSLLNLFFYFAFSSIWFSVLDVNLKNFVFAWVCRQKRKIKKSCLNTRISTKISFSNFSNHCLFFHDRIWIFATTSLIFLLLLIPLWDLCFWQQCRMIDKKIGPRNKAFSSRKPLKSIVNSQVSLFENAWKLLLHFFFWIYISSPCANSVKETRQNNWWRHQFYFPLFPIEILTICSKFCFTS